MRKTIAVHVRYKFLYISLPSYAKPTRNDQIPRCLGNVNDNGEFFVYLVELNAFAAYSAEASFNTDAHSVVPNNCEITK